MEIKLLLFKLYVKLIRPYTEKFLNDKAEKKYKVNNDVWSTIKNLPLHDFSREINTYEYSSDRLGGLLDHSFNHPNYFFVEKGYGRDCLLPDQPIPCFINGEFTILPIEFIYNNKEKDIYCLDEKGGKQKVYSITKKISDKPVITYGGYGGILHTTNDHKVFSEGEFKEIKNCVPSMFEYKYKNTSNFADIDLAWLYGFFCADGYATLYNNKRRFVTLTNTNEQYIEKSLFILNKYFPGYFKRTFYKSDEQGNVRGNTYLKNAQHKIIMCTKGTGIKNTSRKRRDEIFDIFYNMYDNKKRKIIPNYILNANKEILKSFLYGYWDGNGSKDTNFGDKFTLTIPNIILTSQLYHICYVLGYQSIYVYPNKNKNAFTLRVHKNKILTTNIKKSPFFIKKYRGEVYDITVESGAFLVNNYLVKNCDNFTRMIKYWAIYNNVEAQEVIVSSKSHIIQDAHVVTVLHMDGYYLCDYGVYGPFTTFEDAVYNIPDRWEKYNKDDFIYELYNGIYLSREEL